MTPCGPKFQVNRNEWNCRTHFSVTNRYIIIKFFLFSSSGPPPGPPPALSDDEDEPSAKATDPAQRALIVAMEREKRLREAEEMVLQQGLVDPNAVMMQRRIR